MGIQRQFAKVLVLRLVVLALFVTTASLASTAGARTAPRLAVFTVNADDDAPDGVCDARHCNLREAIEAANTYPRLAAIRFAIGASNVLIQPLSALPALNGDVDLDGTTQPGTACPLPVVRIDGALLPRGPVRNARTPVSAVPAGFVSGLVIVGDRNRVRGLIVSNFPGDGIVVRGNSNTLQCLLVGTDETGMAAAGNGGHGIVVDDGILNAIGGRERAHGNVIAANGGMGLRLRNAVATAEHFNFIGVDVLGQPTLRNGNADPGVDDGPAPAPLSPAAAARFERLIGAQIARLNGKYDSALLDGGIFERYVALLKKRGVRSRPSNLGELANALVARPDLYAAFAREIAAIGDASVRGAAGQLDRSRVRFQASPTFLSEVGPFDSPLDLSDQVEAIDPDDVVIAPPPSNELVFRRFDPTPILFAPFRFATFRTWGPTSFGGTAIDLVDACAGPAPCNWPIVYDLKPRAIRLIWDTNVLTPAEVADIVAEQGYFFGLRLNGTLLARGSLSQYQSDFTRAYFAANLPANECPDPNRPCIAMEVRVRDGVVGGNALPWTFELRVERIDDLNIPQLIGIDELGNPIFVTQEAVLINQSFKTFNPNATNDDSWFVTAMEPSFRSDRCVECHGFGTPDALAAHHGYSNVASYIQQTNLQLAPSLFVPGAHVMTCINCHHVPLVNPDGNPFHEVEWRAPYVDLDVDWSTKTASQICQRVRANLPDKLLRHLHFHGDGRLFWAVAEPKIMGSLHPPKAQPQDYDEFLRRFDNWNLGGAPCP